MTSVVTLTEYESIEVELGAEDALALAATRVVDVQPSWGAHRYRVKAGSKVGTLSVSPHLTLHVQPKLPIRRVVYLLCHAVGLARWDDSLVQLEEDHELDLALVVAYLAATEQTLQRGPHSAYYVVEEDLNELRGRIDANRQRLRYGLPLPVAVTYDDFGVDTDENRLLAGAAVQLQRLPGLPGSIRRRLRRVLAALDGVEPARRDSARASHLTRLNEHYRPALALARAVLAGVSFETRAGPRSVTGLTVDMNQLFEKFLEVALQEALAGVPGSQLSPQCSDYLDDDKRAQIKPDLTWVVNGAPRAVIDAKYKSIEDGRPAEADIYQVVSYAIALSLDRAFLVYATPATWKPPLAIRSSTIRVTVNGLDLALPLPDLRAAIATLAINIATDPHLQAAVHTDP